MTLALEILALPKRQKHKRALKRMDDEHISAFRIVSYLLIMFYQCVCELMLCT